MAESCQKARTIRGLACIASTHIFDARYWRINLDHRLLSCPKSDCMLSRQCSYPESRDRYLFRCEANNRVEASPGRRKTGRTYTICIYIRRRTQRRSCTLFSGKSIHIYLRRIDDWGDTIPSGLTVASLPILASRLPCYSSRSPGCRPKFTFPVRPF